MYIQCIKEQLNLAWRTLTFAIPNICLFFRLKIAFPLGLILICQFCLCLSYLLEISRVLLNITQSLVDNWNPIQRNIIKVECQIVIKMSDHFKRQNIKTIYSKPHRGKLSHQTPVGFAITQTPLPAGNLYSQVIAKCATCSTLMCHQKSPLPPYHIDRASPSPFPDVGWMYKINYGDGMLSKSFPRCWMQQINCGDGTLPFFNISL